MDDQVFWFHPSTTRSSDSLLPLICSNSPSSWATVKSFFRCSVMPRMILPRSISDSETRSLWEYNQAKVSKLIARIPMSKWSGSSKGLVTFENDQFSLNVNVLPEELELLRQWTREICLYRLHLHFERREDKGK
jgi:hypothetical protein